MVRHALVSVMRWDDIPAHVMIIGIMSTDQGGLGILYPSHHAVPDYVLGMVLSVCYIREEGIDLNEDVVDITMHESIGYLYQCKSNPESTILKNYEALVTQVAKAALSPKSRGRESGSAHDKHLDLQHTKHDKTGQQYPHQEIACPPYVCRGKRALPPPAKHHVAPVVVSAHCYFKEQPRTQTA